MFFNKSNQIIKQLNLHAQAVITCFNEYQVGILELVKIQSKQPFDKEAQIAIVNKIVTLEREADIIRHQVIRDLLQGGLLVDSRKSTMRLIEGIDLIANIAEDCIQMICDENIVLDPWISHSIHEINTLTGKQLELLIEVLLQIVTKYNMDDVLLQIEEIEHLESQADQVENMLIKDLFEKELDLSLKLHYKQFIRLVTSMSDIIEDLSDEVEIILASRRI